MGTGKISSVRGGEQVATVNSLTLIKRGTSKHTAAFLTRRAVARHNDTGKKGEQTMDYIGKKKKNANFRLEVGRGHWRLRRQ